MSEVEKLVDLMSKRYLEKCPNNTAARMLRIVLSKIKNGGVIDGITFNPEDKIIKIRLKPEFEKFLNEK